MKRTLIGLALSALVTLFFLWLIVSGFGQLMDLLRGVNRPGAGPMPLLVIGLAVFIPLLIYRVRKSRKAREAKRKSGF